MKYYTGIGSRDTPEDIKVLFSAVASCLENRGYILRSGAAKGSDSAFEQGVIGSAKEIYLPWPAFENSDSQLIVSNYQAFEIAETFHPYWKNLSNGAKKLQARNSCQVLGLDLKTPSSFIVCYTKSGERKGGTGQALRIADSYGIPIFDAGLFKNTTDIDRELKVFLRKYAKE